METLDNVSLNFSLTMLLIPLLLWWRGISWERVFSPAPLSLKILQGLAVTAMVGNAVLNLAFHSGFISSLILVPYVVSL